MIQQRFRHRNGIEAEGDYRFEQYGHMPNTSSSCQTPTLGWYLNAATAGGHHQVIVDTMDDIAGDPPDRKIGTAGYKFHPMIRVKARVSGGGPASWTVRYKAKNCAGQPGEHQTMVRRMPQGMLGRRWSGLVLPMLGNRLDMSKVPYPAVEVARLRGLAETAVRAKRGRLGETNLYESLAEIDRTIGMLKDMFDRARRIQKTAFFGKKGSSRARSFTDEAAGQYLATRYGFAPTVSDITAILVGLEKPLGKILKTTRHKETWGSKQTTSQGTQGDSGLVNYYFVNTMEHELSVTAISLDSVEITLLRALGLGLKDLASLPWELVTLSFVADWFANIGDFLSSLAPDVDISNVGSCVVIEWRCTQEIKYSFLGNPRTDTDIISVTPPGDCTRVIHYKERTVGLGLPSLQWKTDFKFDSALRSLDALALFTAQTSKVQANLKPTTTLHEELMKVRRRQPSQKGRRSAEDYRNLGD